MADGDCAAPGHNVDATTIADAKSKRYRWMMSGHRGKSYSFKGKQSEALNSGYKVGTTGEAQMYFSIPSKYFYLIYNSIYQIKNKE